MTPRSKDLVIVIDQSNLMGRVFGGRTLLEYAQRAAAVIVDTLQIRDRVRPDT